MIEILGPAAGPYSDYLEARQVIRDNEGQTAPVFEVYRIYTHYTQAAVDLADALILAAETDMLHPDVHEAVEGLLEGYADVRATDEAKGSTRSWDARIGAAMDIATCVTDTLE